MGLKMSNWALLVEMRSKFESNEVLVGDVMHLAIN